MPTMTVSLPDATKAWVDDQVKDGRFSDLSEYVLYLIRRDRERAGAIAALQGAIDEGMGSGPAEPFDAEAFKREMRERYAGE